MMFFLKSLQRSGYFDTIISNMLHWKCDLCFREVIGSVTEEQFTNEMKLVYQYFSYWMDYKDMLELLMKINRYDIIYACHMNAALTVQEKFGANSTTREHTAIIFRLSEPVLRSVF